MHLFFRLDFGNSFNMNPTKFYGNGDEYVNKRSLAGCGRWEKNTSQGKRIYQKEFLGLDHVTILDNSESINYIVETVINNTNDDKD